MVGWGRRGAGGGSSFRVHTHPPPRTHAPTCPHIHARPLAPGSFLLFRWRSVVSWPFILEKRKHVFRKSPHLGSGSGVCPRSSCFLNPHRDQTAGAMDHSQVSAALLLFLPFMVVPFMGQCITTEPATAREMALSSLICSQTCSYPDEGAKPGSTQILQITTSFAIFPKWFPNAYQMECKRRPNAHLLLPNGIQMRRKWSPNGYQMERKCNPIECLNDN